MSVAGRFLSTLNLTPIRIDIDRDVEGWTPPPGMVDDLGGQLEDREYNQKDMDRTLVLNQRTKLVAERVMKFLRATDPMSKTIIFCEDIDHAERMCDTLKARLTDAAETQRHLADTITERAAA